MYFHLGPTRGWHEFNEKQKVTQNLERGREALFSLKNKKETK
jgi:hypothetical protein